MQSKENSSRPSEDVQMSSSENTFQSQDKAKRKRNRNNKKGAGQGSQADHEETKDQPKQQKPKETRPKQGALQASTEKGFTGDKETWFDGKRSV
jgi:hypothetical protein